MPQASRGPPPRRQLDETLLRAAVGVRGRKGRRPWASASVLCSCEVLWSLAGPPSQPQARHSLLKRRGCPSPSGSRRLRRGDRGADHAREPLQLPQRGVRQPRLHPERARHPDRPGHAPAGRTAREPVNPAKGGVHRGAARCGDLTTQQERLTLAPEVREPDPPSAGTELHPRHPTLAGGAEDSVPGETGKLSNQRFPRAVAIHAVEFRGRWCVDEEEDVGVVRCPERRQSETSHTLAALTFSRADEYPEIER